MNETVAIVLLALAIFGVSYLLGYAMRIIDEMPKRMK